MANHRVCRLCLLLFVVLAGTSLQAKTCIFNTKIFASNNPFESCPAGTDTIIIRDTMLLDVSYEPLISGFPFDGPLMVDGGVLYWSNNSIFKLGANARIILCGSGHLYPDNPNEILCNSLKTIYFDFFKVASCDGSNGLLSFSKVNKARCLDAAGLCTPGCLALSVDPALANTGWRLFPNPVSETLHVVSDNSGSAYLRIFDAIGRLIWEKTSWLDSVEPVEIQEVARFQDGIFFLEILTPQGRPLFTKRFLKVNE